MKYFFILLGAILVLCLVGFSMVIVKRPAARPAMKVTFLSFTNDAAGTRLADFSISNASPWAVERNSLGYIQALGRGRTGKERWTNCSGFWLPSGGRILPAGSSEIVTITAPTNQNHWRVSFSAIKDEGVLYKMASEMILSAQRAGLPTKHRRPSYGTASDPIQE